jgi:serine protease
MYTRLFGLVALLAALAIVGSAQQPPTPRPGSRERIPDVPTPGHLGGLRREAAPQITLDTTGVAESVPSSWDVDPATGAQYRKGELLVQFKEGVDSTLRARAMQAARGSRFARTYPGNWTLVELRPEADALESVGVLRDRAEVRDVSLNYRVRTQQFRPNDEFYRLQWNFDAINMPTAWQINEGARNDIVVAVVDSGLNISTETIVFSSPIVGQIPVRFAQVPDLVTSDRIVNPFDFVYDDDLPVDLAGHGTHVAGTIAQQTNNSLGVAGVAFNVKLMPLKVISGGSLVSWDDIFNPGNPGGTAAVLAEAIRYAADNGAKVINLSLGGTGGASIEREAISYAVSRGAFVAIAAGNSAEEGNPEIFPASYAADIDGAIAVGAVNRSLRHAPYSSFHSYVEICAPGGEVESDFDYEGGVTQVGYEEVSTLSFLTAAEKILALRLGFRPRFDRFELRPFNGTSMATPHVSGIAALLYSQGLQNPAAIEAAIKRFARPISASAEECGAGLVDARRALRGLGLSR